MTDIERKKHYDLLKECSDKEDMTEWNEFALELIRSGNRINLEGANLNGAYLEGAFLFQAHLKDAKLSVAHLKGADLRAAQLGGTILSDSHIEDADLHHAHLEGVSLVRTSLEGTELNYATCNGSTKIIDCNIDKQTDFRGVGLDSIQFSPGLKQLIEYNNRRLNWEDWYLERSWLKSLPVKSFWWLSDYGNSTVRIVGTFFFLALIFALLYEYFPGMIHDSVSKKDIINFNDLPPSPRKFLRALYFSVITMTTLGFGDMHADPKSVWGHLALIFQVIMGYVILGALVTRLAILFSSDGPSAKNVEKKGSLENWRYKPPL